MTMEEEAIRKSLVHWDKMISWASKQPKTKKPDKVKMNMEIEEDWFSNDCPLCQFHFVDFCLNCGNCLLAKTFGLCKSSNENNKWARVEESKTWKEWVTNAQIFRKQLAMLIGEKN